MEEKTLLEASLLFPVRDGRVHLALKKRKIGTGCWNGYGGGPEPEDGGDMRVTALRELLQEGRVVGDPHHLKKVATCYFMNEKTDGTAFTVKVHAYILSDWDGELQATEEMGAPKQFDVGNLPIESMMPADSYWIPRVLAGETGVVRAHYAPLQKELVGPVEFIPTPADELP